MVGPLHSRSGSCPALYGSYGASYLSQPDRDPSCRTPKREAGVPAGPEGWGHRPTLAGTIASPRHQSHVETTSRDGGHGGGDEAFVCSAMRAQGAHNEPRSLLYRRQGRGAQARRQRKQRCAAGQATGARACDAIGAIARRRKRRGLPQTRSRVGGSKNSSGMRTPHLGVTPKLGSSECVERVSSGCAAWWHATPHIYVCVYVVRA